MPEMHVAETRWIIFENRFSNQKRGDSILSPNFESSTFMPAKWYLKLYPRGYGTSKGDAVSVYLYCESTQRVNARYEIRLENCVNADATAKCCISTTFHRNISNSGRKQFVLFDSVLNPDEGFMNDGALLLTCRIEFEPLPALSPPTASSLLSRLPFRNLSNHAPSLKDATVITKSQEISVSSTVLSKHSPVFKEMFEAEKSAKKKLHIDDYEVDLIQKVIDYCHYENKEISIEEDAQELLLFAEKYRIKGLVVLCRKHFCQFPSVAVEN